MLGLPAREPEYLNPPIPLLSVAFAISLEAARIPLWKSIGVRNRGGGRDYFFCHFIAPCSPSRTRAERPRRLRGLRSLTAARAAMFPRRAIPPKIISETCDHEHHCQSFLPLSRQCI